MAIVYFDSSVEHGLRGADAVHLASALAVAPDLVIAAWDLRVAAAARQLGFSTVP
ncbi:hypothetical protein [Nakamurella sp.]|uniref:hypothetical protein n=1 Tax=Nakamurella sp. TaxID=1869182 RepID=UPI003785177A